jgi:hypothetical protein
MKESGRGDRGLVAVAEGGVRKRRRNRKEEQQQQANNGEGSAGQCETGHGEAGHKTVLFSTPGRGNRGAHSNDSVMPCLVPSSSRNTASNVCSRNIRSWPYFARKVGFFSKKALEEGTCRGTVPAGQKGRQRQ